MKLKKIWMILLSVVFVSTLFGCAEGETYVEVPSSRDLKEVIFSYENLTDGTYLTYDLFMSTYDCHLFKYSSEGDSSYRLSEKAFTETLDIIDEYNMQSWESMTDHMTAVDGVHYSLTMRDFTDDKVAESDHMPENGEEAFHKIRSIIETYIKTGEKEEAEKVTVNGKEYEIKVGSDIILYGDDAWWEVENFVGTYTSTEDSKKKSKEDGLFEVNATLTVNSDGSVKLTLDDETYEGYCDEIRHNESAATAIDGRIGFDYTEKYDENTLYVLVYAEDCYNVECDFYLERK